jgi:hypothetical protein
MLGTRTAKHPGASSPEQLQWIEIPLDLAAVAVAAVDRSRSSAVVAAVVGDGIVVAAVVAAVVGDGIVAVCACSMCEGLLEKRRFSICLYPSFFLSFFIFTNVCKSDFILFICQCFLSSSSSSSILWQLMAVVKVFIIATMIVIVAIVIATVALVVMVAVIANMRTLVETVVIVAIVIATVALVVIVAVIATMRTLVETVVMVAIITTVALVVIVAVIATMRTLLKNGISNKRTLDETAYYYSLLFKRLNTRFTNCIQDSLAFNVFSCSIGLEIFFNIRFR